MSFILDKLSTEPFAVIGHRGAPGYKIENTIPSFELAMKMGVDVVECDVRLSADGIPVVFHDEDLSRLTGINKKVSELEWSELKKIYVGGERIPSLEEVITMISGKIGLFIEIKDERATQPVLELIKDKDASDWVAIISFIDTVLKEARKEKNLVTGLLYFKPPGRIFEAKKLGAKIVLPRYNIATKKANETAHRVKLKVVTWVINTVELAEKMYRNQVDGMATDYPDKIIEYREKLKEGST